MTKPYLIAFFLLSSALLLPLLINGCQNEPSDPDNDNDTLQSYLTTITGSEQRSGNPTAGHNYLVCRTTFIPLPLAAPATATYSIETATMPM